jgi:RNA polymerase sigma-70 factor (ECF subfamily)
MITSLVDEALGGSRSSRAEVVRRALCATDDLDDLLDAVATRAAEGRPAALELLLELVDRLQLTRPPIARLITDSATVDDVAQATLSTVQRHIASFQGRSRFRTWLWAVARNAALMQLRRRADELSADPDAADGDGPAPAGTPRMSSVVATRQTIQTAIAALPDHYREALELQVYEQLDYAEIADRLQIPVGTVRSRLAKARELLAERLGPR